MDTLITLVGFGVILLIVGIALHAAWGNKEEEE
jgi:hypothetical protein